MTPDAQAWSVYRPDVLPELSPRAGNEGRVVAITATDEAVSGGWATEVALGLARGWSESGLSVTLIDADLVAPVLHEALGVENQAGLTDVLLFGSSLDSVTQEVEGGRFQLVTAGSPAAEPTLAFQHERWPQLCQQTGLTGSTLLVFVPHTAPWSKAILDRATDVVVLAATSIEVDLELRLDTRVRAVLGVESVGPAADESTDPLPVDPLEAMALDVGSRDPLDSDRPADLVAEGDLAATASSADVRHVTPERVTPQQASPSPVATRSPARRVLVWGPAIVLLAAVVVVQAIRRPGAAEPTAPVDTAPVSQPATDPAPAPEQSATLPEAVGPAARYTVTMSAYRDLAMATSRVEALVARTSDFLFILVPIEVGGSVFHRLQAGLAPDSAAAAQLSDELSQALDQPSESWIIRDAPLAFEVARSPSLVAATECRDEVAARAIPAYVLGVEMSDGSVEYRVYAGAYADEGESSHMRSVLDENGLADISLAPRFGTPVR